MMSAEASKFDYLIIGGGIAGTTAAETIRGHDPSGSIGIVSDEPHRLYSRIMLSKPNFFLGKISFDQIWLKKEAWYGENKIEFIAGKKAVGLDPVKKIIRLDNGQDIGYQKLLVATGGCPRLWPIPGTDKQGVFYLQTLDDAKAIIAAMKSAKKAVAVGGGFISFEICEMLRMAGIEVTLVMRESYYWEPLLDQAAGGIIEKAIGQGGVKVIKNSEVEKVEGGDRVCEVVTKDGKRIECDMIITGIGVYCDTEWLRPSGLAIGRGILTNEYLETNLPEVFAAGDAAEFKDIILGHRIQLGNWVNAQSQGRAAGNNMTVSIDKLGTRRPKPFKMVSFYTTQGFGITIAFAGDVRPSQDRIIITRGSPESGSYGRIIIKDGEIVGTTLINRTQELWAISKLIESDAKVDGLEKELTDPSFELKQLLRK